jgi:macrophage erythroblast attacher
LFWPNQPVEARRLQQLKISFNPQPPGMQDGSFRFINIGDSASEKDSQRLYSENRWNDLAELFVKTHSSLYSLPTRPLLHIALSAGLSALKTPTCHAPHLVTHSNSADKSERSGSSALNVCPICSTELKYLARGLPYAHHTKSHVDPDAMVLPNNRVYGRERLFSLATNIGVPAGKVRDPVTGETFDETTLRKVFIT